MYQPTLHASLPKPRASTCQEVMAAVPGRGETTAPRKVQAQEQLQSQSILSKDIA